MENRRTKGRQGRRIIRISHVQLLRAHCWRDREGEELSGNCMPLCLCVERVTEKARMTLFPVLALIQLFRLYSFEW